MIHCYRIECNCRENVVVQFDCHPEQAFFVQRRIWASRAKGYVLCDPIVARLARFLLKLHHYRKCRDAAPHSFGEVDFRAESLDMCRWSKIDNEQEENKAAEKLSADYATPTDFCAIFRENMPSLYRLAFLLTADQDKAEQCFVAGLEDCRSGNPVFREWARSWAKRIIIKDAIELITPRLNSGHDVPNLQPQGARQPRADHLFSAVTQLRPFDRIVFVVTILEQYSVQDCALLLGCSQSDVVPARNRALQEISEGIHLTSSNSKDGNYERSCNVLS